MRSICGQRGIKKGLCEVITPEVLNDFNLDGTHNIFYYHYLYKIYAYIVWWVFLCTCLFLLFIDYSLFFFITAGTYCEGNTDKSFKADIRDGLKLAKNRNCKEKVYYQRKYC